MNTEIILVNVEKSCLDDLLIEKLNIFNSQILSSYFYDTDLNKDITIKDIKSFIDIFQQPNTGNIYLKQLNLGTEIKDIMIILSFDIKVGDIVINFPSDELLSNINDCLLIVKYLMNLIIQYQISEIRIGFEPAYDEDMTLHVIKSSSEDVNMITNKLRSFKK